MLFDRIVRFSIEHRLIVFSMVGAVALLGLYNYQRLTIDAVPDITNTQVVVNTEAPGFTPLEVEQRITFPLETAWEDCPTCVTPVRFQATDCPKSLWSLRTAPISIYVGSWSPKGCRRGEAGSPRVCSPPWSDRYGVG